jgi:hypothetical protein
MVGLSHEDALVRVIRIQKQMIDDFAIIFCRINTAISVMSGLDEEFRHIFFCRELAYDPENLPASVPNKQELDEALRTLGFTSITPPDFAFWKSIIKTQNPWKDLDTGKAIHRGICPDFRGKRGD